MVLDSRCSKHMNSNASLLTEIKQRGHRSITLGDKSIGKVIGIGKIAKDPSNSIENVYLLDRLKFNR